MIHPVDYSPSQDFGDNPTANLPASSWIIQQFGNYQPDGHTGVDYPCPVGTPVKAAAAGMVVHVGRLGGTYADNPWWIAPSFAGFVYVVDHGHFVGIYGHCMDGGARVTNGQSVSEGQTLGLSGNTGASTGPHLHFEVLPDGYRLNSRMYGRVNPSTLYGLSYAGTTTPQEDELSAAEVQIIVNAVNMVHKRLDEELAGKVWAYKNGEDRDAYQILRDVPKDVWRTPIDYRDPATGQLVKGGTTGETVLSYVDTNTSKILDAKTVVASIPDEMAREVLDLLSQRIGGK